MCEQDMQKRRTHIQVIGNNRNSLEQKVLLIKIPHTKVWGAVNNYKSIKNFRGRVGLLYLIPWLNFVEVKNKGLQNFFWCFFFLE